MSHIIRINDDQLDEIIRSELKLARDCCDAEEKDLIEALNKVIDLYTPVSEIIAREQGQQHTYMYGKLDSEVIQPDSVRVSYHFGV